MSRQSEWQHMPKRIYFTQIEHTYRDWEVYTVTQPSGEIISVPISKTKVYPNYVEVEDEDK